MWMEDPVPRQPAGPCEAASAIMSLILLPPHDDIVPAEPWGSLAVAPPQLQSPNPAEGCVCVAKVISLPGHSEGIAVLGPCRSEPHASHMAQDKILPSIAKGKAQACVRSLSVPQEADFSDHSSPPWVRPCAHMLHQGTMVRVPDCRGGLWQPGPAWFYSCWGHSRRVSVPPLVTFFCSLSPPPSGTSERVLHCVPDGLDLESAGRCMCSQEPAANP